MVKKSNVYTATGDKGLTSLVGGKRVKKNDVRIEAYGTIDELNSFIGVLDNLHNIPTDAKSQLRIIQNKLFNIGAYVATDFPVGVESKVAGLSDVDICNIERWIDEMDAELPPLRNFVLPGGSRISSFAHVCRTVARRCERRIIALGERCYIDPNVVVFVNRLSDYFFVLARFNNVHNQIEEIFWDKDC